MTYPEWKNTFVVDDNHITSKATTSASNNGIMKSRSSGTQSAVTKTQVVQIAGVNCVEKDLPNFSLSVGGKQGISKVRDCISYITPDNTRFIFPKNLNINKQSMTPERAIGLWMQVPEEIRTRSCGEIQFVDYYNPQDSYWRKIYTNFTRSYATGGGSNMTFYRCVRHNDDYVIKTFCHETGHYIDVQNTVGGIRYSASPQWKNAMHEDMQHSGKTSVTTYGENSPAEDFAESITEYEANAAQFEKDFPNRFKLIKAILTKGGGSP